MEKLLQQLFCISRELFWKSIRKEVGEMSKGLKEIHLTQMTKTAGWAAKIGPETLAQVLGKLPKFEDENLIVGIETSDDAAIYKVTDDIAMIQTVDFFTPIVDDPYMFGQIAAANSLSDV